MKKGWYVVERTEIPDFSTDEEYEMFIEETHLYGWDHPDLIPFPEFELLFWNGKHWIEYGCKVEPYGFRPYLYVDIRSLAIPQSSIPFKGDE